MFKITCITGLEVTCDTPDELRAALINISAIRYEEANVLDPALTPFNQATCDHTHDGPLHTTAPSPAPSPAPVNVATNEDTRPTPPGRVNAAIHPGVELPKSLGEVYQFSWGYRCYNHEDEPCDTLRHYYSLRAALEVLLPHLIGDELERSELYRLRMFAISSAALGWHKKDSVHLEYVTSALDDVHKLYQNYLEVRKERDEARESAEALREANCTFASQAIHPNEELPNPSEVAYKEIVALAQRHGYQGSGDDGNQLVCQLSDWLDTFVKVTNNCNTLNTRLNETQAAFNGVCNEKLRLEKGEAAALAYLTDLERADETLRKNHGKLFKKWKSAKIHIEQLKAANEQLISTMNRSKS